MQNKKYIHNIVKNNFKPFCEWDKETEASCAGEGIFE